MQHKLAKSPRRGIVEDRARRRLGMRLLVLEDEDIERIESLAGGGSNVLDRFGRPPVALRDGVAARVLDERSYEEIAGELRGWHVVLASPTQKRLGRSRGSGGLRRRALVASRRSSWSR